MSAKRFSSREKVAPLALRAANRVTVVLLAISLVGGGCATTPSQTSSNKAHKPQMITADGVEEVGSSTIEHAFSNGIGLPDSWANTLTVMGPAFQILGQLLACH